MQFRLLFKTTPKAIQRILVPALLPASLLVSTNLMANSCSKADIDYYLQRGFTHDQVVRLCSTRAVPDTAQSTPANSVIRSSNPAGSHYAPRSQSSQAQSSQNNLVLARDQVYFETVLNATSANLTPAALSYNSKECVEYGEVNLGGLRDKACANTKVTLQFNGLEVLRAVKGIFLIRDQQMIVRGNIHREYININLLKPGQQAVLRAQLPENPSQLDLPVRKGIDPKQVAARLEKYIPQ